MSHGLWTPKSRFGAVLELSNLEGRWRGREISNLGSLEEVGTAVLAFDWELQAWSLYLYSST